MKQTFHSCVRKVRHVTLDQARKARDRMSRKHPEIRFNAYYCGMCGGYHVGRD